MKDLDENLKIQLVTRLKKSLSAVEPSGVRALCLKLAYEQCVFYDELMGELSQVLELLASQPMSMTRLARVG